MNINNPSNEFDNVTNFMFGGFYDEEYEKHVNSVLNDLIEKYETIGYGRNRIVLKLSDNYVLKFPLNDNGIADNDWEGSLYHSDDNSDPDDIQYPRSKWIKYKDIICCVMEMITPVQSEDGLPEWIQSVDCGQVGYTKKGKLVAFDYGLR